jgi:hypothetical protein
VPFGSGVELRTIWAEQTVAADTGPPVRFLGVRRQLGGPVRLNGGGVLIDVSENAKAARFRDPAALINVKLSYHLRNACLFTGVMLRMCHV